MVTTKDFNALEDSAILELDIKPAEVGDRFKMIGDARRRGGQWWNVDVVKLLVIEPFPNPAGFNFVGLQLTHEHGIFTATRIEIMIFRPEIKLAQRPVGIQAINQRFWRIDGAAGCRGVK